MCGICGILTSQHPRHLAEEIESMRSTARHRGPDDSGWVVLSGSGAVAASDSGTSEGLPGDVSARGHLAALGHQRLSIIDLSPAGHQPMSDASGRYWMVYNGEVYNYVELRAELRALGCVFRSASDTEVVLQAYITWGSACVERFNGMWAFAVYDCAEETLFCSRDRFGIKPFYFVAGGGRFAFASEIKQLLSLSWVDARTNADVLGDFLCWGFENHTDETFFVGIRNLPGGHSLVVGPQELDRGSFVPRSFWSPRPARLRPESDSVTGFRDLLHDSVRLRLRSDVPVGLTLSGGLDSSSVTCVAGAVREAGDGGPLRAFNVEYGDRGYSERRFAEAAALRAGAELVTLRPSSDDLVANWERFIWHMEQPISSLSYFSNYQIYSLIRERGVPVVLSGQGGDEVLLGYDRYRTHDLRFAFREGDWRRVSAQLVGARRHGGMTARRQAADGAYFTWPWLRAMRRRRLVRPYLRREVFDSWSGNVGQLRSEARHSERVSLHLSEVTRFQLPHLLHHEDRMSMAHSVETRLPFLDFRLLEFVLGQDPNLFFRDGWSKSVLRRAMEGVLPEVVRCRTDKMGYETPTGRLLAQNHRWFQTILERNRDDAYLDVSSIERGFDRGVVHERFLCSVLSYLSWRERFSVS